MNKPNEAVELLKNEYGIKTMRDLDEAISKLGFLDISLFCTELCKQTNCKEEMK